jgi:hypothetical protein
MLGILMVERFRMPASLLGDPLEQVSWLSKQLP